MLCLVKTAMWCVHQQTYFLCSLSQHFFLFTHLFNKTEKDKQDHQTYIATIGMAYPKSSEFHTIKVQNRDQPEFTFYMGQSTSPFDSSCLAASLCKRRMEAQSKMRYSLSTFLFIFQVVVLKIISRFLFVSCLPKQLYKIINATNICIWVCKLKICP